MMLPIGAPAHGWKLIFCISQALLMTKSKGAGKGAEGNILVQGKADLGSVVEEREARLGSYNYAGSKPCSLGSFPSTSEVAQE